MKILTIVSQIACAVLLVGWAAASPPVEVLHVPRGDVPKLIGDAREGVTLPLNEILSLVEQAGRKTATAESLEGVQITALPLAGTIEGELLECTGAISFVNSSPEPSAIRLSGDGIQWTGQSMEGTEEPSGFLVKVDGAVWLVAEGNASGSLEISATVQSSSGGWWSLDALNCPAYWRITMPEGSEPRSCNAPSVLNRMTEESIFEVWPIQNQATRFALRQTTPFDGESVFRASVNRGVNVSDGTLLINDQVVVSGRIEAGKSIRFELPGGLELLTVDSKDDIELIRTPEAVEATARHEMAGMRIVAEFVPRISDKTMRLGTWEIDNCVRNDFLHLSSSGELIPVLMQQPDYFVEARQDEDYRTWMIGQALPTIDVAIVPARAERAPSVSSTIQFNERVASAVAQIHLVDTRSGTVEFSAPSDWNVTKITATVDGHAVDVGTTVRDAVRHLVSWQPDQGVDIVRVEMQRPMAFDVTGKDIEFVLPRLALADGSALTEEAVVTWNEALDVRNGTFRDAMVVTEEELTFPELNGTRGNLAIRATGAAPEARLLVKRREPDVRSRVATLLTVEEDRLVVQSTLFYTVRFAPKDRFRFILPAGTGNFVRLTGGAIRESGFEAHGDGELWTVQTQHGIVGDWAVSLEWTIPYDPNASIQAPQVSIQDVSSQRGWLALEASPSLRLDVEARQLTEADPSELPAVAWQSGRRLLNVWRYLRPPYDLRITPERFIPEDALRAIVAEAEVTSTVSPEGERFTEAVYKVMPRSERQFFEVILPMQAELWSVLVNGEGEKPATRIESDGSRRLLVPLPAVAMGTETMTVRLMYRESGAALNAGTRLELNGPRVPVPVNRTTWNLNLPPGFEYLAFEGSFGPTVFPRVPFATFLRSAYYPEKLIFDDTSTGGVVFFAIFLVFLVVIYAGVSEYYRRYQQQSSAGSEASSSRQESRGCTVSLIELIVVVGIIAILSAIATPNFLEAQTRSKVSRALSDMRSMRTGLEAYYIDQNSYPHKPEILWQGTVKYLSGPFTDPFAQPSGTSLRYLVHGAALDRARSAGLIGPGENTQWMLYSIGPDGIDDDGRMLYDPTNGTLSSGDVIAIQRAEEKSGWDSYYGDRVSRMDDQVKDRGQRHKMLEQAPMEETAPRSANEPMAQMPPVVITDGEYDPAKGTVSSGDLWRVKEGTEEEMAELEASNRLAEKPAGPFSRTESAEEDNAFGWNSESDGDILLGISTTEAGASSTAGSGGLVGGKQALVISTKTRSREAGLLSLDIETPRGGVQRRFEGLFEDAQLSVRLLEEQRFQRARFLVKFIAFLILALVWWKRRDAFRHVFISILAIALIVPVIVPGPWAAFFNAVIQGCLLALVLPVLGWMIRRVNRRLPSRAMVGVIFLGVLTGSAPAFADETAQPVRLIVPYDEDSLATQTTGISSTFVDRTTFEALWNAAHSDEEITPRKRFAALADFQLNGHVDLDRDNMQGTVTVLAVNMKETPARIALKMREAVLDDLSGAQDASIEATSDGYILVLAPNTCASYTIGFSLPCLLKGSEGEFTLSMPECASGNWNVEVPLSALNVETSDRSTPIQKSTETGTLLSGFVKSGINKVRWQADTLTVRDGEAEAQSWSAKMDTDIRWNHLGWAEWRAEMQFEVVGQSGVLPREVALPVDSSIQLSSGTGDGLRRVRIKDNVAYLTLDAKRTVTVILNGIVSGAKRDGGRYMWSIGGIRLGENHVKSQNIRVEWSEGFQVASLDSAGLVRHSAQDVSRGFSAHQFEVVKSDWALSMELQSQAPDYEVETNEIVSLVPGQPIRRMLAKVYFHDFALPTLSFDVPEGVQVMDVNGPDGVDWIQIGNRLDVRVPSAVIGNELELDVQSRFVRPSGALVTLMPFRVSGVPKSQTRLAVSVPVDMDLIERDLAGATVSSQCIQRLRTFPDLMAQYSLNSAHSWELKDNQKPLEFELKPVTRSAFTSVYNRVTISDGNQHLHAVVRCEPRRGRLDTVYARVLLPKADSEAANRLDISGPVRSVETNWESDRELLVTARLSIPVSQSVELTMTLDQPFDATDEGTHHAPVVLPINEERVKALLLLRRDFEGQFADPSAEGGRVIDPSEADWPSAEFAPLPSDLAFELPADAKRLPTFHVLRHSREEALRAVVEVLRLRVIITEDGFERHELEIAMQNQSEQFLRIALPAEKKDVTLYEVRVADRVVDAVFATEQGRDVLLVPLNRTGLLDPELTVRVAYTVDARAAFESGSVREQAQPEILGGVPVAQSALILMLPSTWSYSDFEGTLNRVELVDIELDEALRRARKVEQLSEAIMNVEESDKLEQAVENLNRLQSKLDTDLYTANQQYNAYGREQSRQMAQQSIDTFQFDSKLADERRRNLSLANESQTALYSNVMTLQNKLEIKKNKAPQVTQQDVFQVQKPTSPQTVKTPPITFPREGDVFVFRQLQGTGNVQFQMSSRESQAHRYNAMMAVGLILGIGLLMTMGRRLFTSPRRIIAAVVIVGTLLVVLGVARDLGILLIATSVATLLFRAIRASRVSGTELV